MTDPVRRHAVVHGRVQGVGFRWSTRREAERRGLSGYARNLDDGTVEVEFEGPAATVDEALDWLRQGPPGAEVERVEVAEAEPELRRSDFRIG